MLREEREAWATRMQFYVVSCAIQRHMSARDQSAPPVMEGCASIVSDSCPLHTMAPALTGHVDATGGHTNHSP